MARARRAIYCPRDPIGLGEEEAAAFLGISPSLFRKGWSQDKMFPSPRRIYSRNVWDVDELMQAFKRVPKADKSTEEDVDWAMP